MIYNAMFKAVMKVKRGLIGPPLLARPRGGPLSLESPNLVERGPPCLIVFLLFFMAFHWHGTLMSRVSLFTRNGFLQTDTEFLEKTT